MCQMVYYTCPVGGRYEEITMQDKTCAACDCKLDETAITVTLGGVAVEVCCEDCAVKLKEADESIKRDTNRPNV